MTCVDVGSTYTKACRVSADGRLLARAEVPTTAATDVLHGLDAAVTAVGGDGGEVAVCSSAGGGLRLAVVGYEPLVTAEAGHRVGLSAGAQVVHVHAGALDAAGVRALRAACPDVILLVGGTDGGDEDTIRHNAARLGAARVRVPVVAAGNSAAAAFVAGQLPAATVVANVLPRIGVLEPGPARAAIREVFLRHVIGGKRLSRGRRFASLVRSATPDAVLAGVELLADLAGCGVLVVDVGGATTDVYSALLPDAELAGGPRRDVAGVLWRSRTVEGDLGVNASAEGTRAAAATEKWDITPGGDGAVGLAAAAAVIGVRRHARGHSAGPGQPRTGGRDLRDVRLIVGSGGVLRHGGGSAVLDAVLGDVGGGWAVPRAARRVVDTDYVLAAAGLLAARQPAAARGLVQRLYAGQASSG
ncbi:glutamate mutase L [Actinoplanes sp. RD1]|uniref:glutamate mutase L n=1 Tax=Actinoplanes sp. RD1 TaxID=3064538 RepID=UPI0027423922|nr:glutamate mutase L [Actinoplanes sp. RD1]